MAKKKIIITGKELHYLAGLRKKLPFHVQSPSFAVVIISTVLWLSISVSIIWLSKGRRPSKHSAYSISIINNSTPTLPQPEYSPPIRKIKLLSQDKQVKKTEEIPHTKTELMQNTAMKNNFTTKQHKETVSVSQSYISQKQSIPPKKKYKQTTLPQLQSAPTITAEKNNLQSNYWNTIFCAISKKLYYPSRAKKHGIEGYVTIQLKIDANGKIINIKKKKASGRLFYTAVLQATKRAAPFPPPSPELSPPLKMEIPVSFRLN